MQQFLTHHNRKILYSLSFIEGASVMAVELLGAKMLAPFFGSSLYVWSTVMAITLGGLALGYFTGGYFSESKKNTNFLFYIVLVAACFSAIMPFNSQLILSLMGSENLVLSIIIATLLFLFPPVFLMGMVSPLIIEKLSTPNHLAGKIAGSIYAISTLGGIIATFAMGFYIIPTFGLSKPAYFIALFLSIIPLMLLYKNKNTTTFIAFFFFINWL
jgi:predicted membrane-bound spermidine synthase